MGGDSGAKRGLGSPLLELRGVSITFGGVRALRGVDLAVWPGEVLALIGPNGAGKTTLFNCVSGFYRTQGEIRLHERNIQGRLPHGRARLGIARTFQNPVLVEDMSALDNVLLGSHTRTRSGFLGSAIGLWRAPAEEKRMGKAALELMEEVGVAAVARRSVSGLPHAVRKRVELARALLSRPDVLLLDEPASALDPEEVATAARVLKALRREHALTSLIVEHNMALVMDLADRVVVLDLGSKIADGTPDEVRRDPAVISSYLGGAA